MHDYQIDFRLGQKLIKPDIDLINWAINQKGIEIQKQICEDRECENTPISLPYNRVAQLKTELRDLIHERELILKYGNI